MRFLFLFSVALLANTLWCNAQSNSLVNTSQSKYAKLSSIDLTSVTWTKGFWAERFAVCKDSMIPYMWKTFKNPEIAHSYRNFEIAAGLQKGEHQGPPFHDGDFYKWLEGVAMVYAVTKDKNIDLLMDTIIMTITKAQRADGYIHTPALIESINSGKKIEFQERLNFETYNLGHLMTAGCVHYRATGKTTLLDAAKKAADYLYAFYKRSSPELARNAICPSHYMGVIELYRTTHDEKYKELAINLINIRGLVENGTDDNQDRIPFRKQTKAMGHAVRANYLYAGVADVYAETGDDSLMRCLDLIWNDMVYRKMYITGACGALYDGTSPDGTSYEPKEVQKVHQSYGRDYQLPNITAHNESCANIGNLLWNYRMLLLTGDAKYTDVMELALYNSILAGVSLDGRRYFYTNPLRVDNHTPYTLRWSKDREEYIKLCNCCPPNTVRTIAEVSNYMYSVSGNGLYVNLYGGNNLITKLQDGSVVKLTQETDYPWDGKVRLTIVDAPKKAFSLFLRVPGWAESGNITVNGQIVEDKAKTAAYSEINRTWKKGEVVELSLPMTVKLIEANPLVEETRNQVAVMRGPVVYCLESPDMPGGKTISDVSVPVSASFRPKHIVIEKSDVVSLEASLKVYQNNGRNNKLYSQVSTSFENVMLRLIPYYAWDNRGKSEMTVWLPVEK
jgi:DUF1680 family protein